MTVEGKVYWDLMEKLAKHRRELSKEEKEQTRKVRSERSRIKIEKGLAWMAKDKPDRLRAIGYTEEQIEELRAMLK